MLRAGLKIVQKKYEIRPVGGTAHPVFSCASSPKRRMYVLYQQAIIWILPVLPGEPIGYPAQPGLIRPSVCPSVCTYLQIRYSTENGTGPIGSVNILQNHESTTNCESEILRKKYKCESNTVNYMKLMILKKIRVIRTCSPAHAQQVFTRLKKESSAEKCSPTTFEYSCAATYREIYILLLYSDCCVDTYYPDNFG